MYMYIYGYVYIIPARPHQGVDNISGFPLGGTFAEPSRNLAEPCGTFVEPCGTFPAKEILKKPFVEPSRNLAEPSRTLRNLPSKGNP